MRIPTSQADSSHALSAFLLLGKADSLGRAEPVLFQGPALGMLEETLSPSVLVQFYAFVNHFNTVTVTEMQCKGEIKITWSLLVWR